MFPIRGLREYLRNRRLQRQERQAEERHRLSRIASLERNYNTKLAVLQTTFANGPDKLHEVQLPDYPGALYLGGVGIEAFVQSQKIEVDQLPDFIGLLQQDHVEVRHRFYSRKNSASFAGHAYIATKLEFSGQTVRVLSNDVDLLCKLAQADFNPPPPWVAFPELGPWIGALQGDAEYWYSNVWDRYWDHLTPDQRTTFLRDRSPGADWEECIRWREPRQC